MPRKEKKKLQDGYEYTFNVIYKRGSDRVENFVIHLVDRFEKESDENNEKMKGFYADRDLLPGRNIIKENFRVINNSRYTIIVVDVSFLKDAWTEYLSEATIKTLVDKDPKKDGTSRVIVISLDATAENIENWCELLCIKEKIYFAGDYTTNDGKWHRIIRALRNEIPLRDVEEPVLETTARQIHAEEESHESASAPCTCSGVQPGTSVTINTQVSRPDVVSYEAANSSDLSGESAGSNAELSGHGRVQNELPERMSRLTSSATPMLQNGQRGNRTADTGNTQAKDAATHQRFHELGVNLRDNVDPNYNAAEGLRADGQAIRQIRTGRQQRHNNAQDITDGMPEDDTAMPAYGVPRDKMAVSEDSKAVSKDKITVAGEEVAAAQGQSNDLPVHFTGGMSENIVQNASNTGPAQLLEDNLGTIQAQISEDGPSNQPQYDSTDGLQTSQQSVQLQSSLPEKAPELQRQDSAYDSISTETGVQSPPSEDQATIPKTVSKPSTDLTSLEPSILMSQPADCGLIHPPYTPVTTTVEQQGATAQVSSQDNEETDSGHCHIESEIENVPTDSVRGEPDGEIDPCLKSQTLKQERRNSEQTRPKTRESNNDTSSTHDSAYFSCQSVSGTADNINEEQGGNTECKRVLISTDKLDHSSPELGLIENDFIPESILVAENSETCLPPAGEQDLNLKEASERCEDISTEQAEEVNKQENEVGNMTFSEQTSNEKTTNSGSTAEVTSANQQQTGILSSLWGWYSNIME